jgi:hypothetical protein
MPLEEDIRVSGAITERKIKEIPKNPKKSKQSFPSLSVSLQTL